MKAPKSFVSLETLGRVRLSRHFEFRNFLYSDIANFYGRSNIPENPDLAIEVGRLLAEHILEPLVETFGPIDIRSAYRSPDLNHFGATEVKPQKCSANSKNYAGHIWDRRDEEGRRGACVSVGIPWFGRQGEVGRDWRDLAWWLYDHLEFHEVYVFGRSAVFNITWRDAPERRIFSYQPPKGALIRNGEVPEGGRDRRYADFPAFRGITYPPIPFA